MSAMRRLIWETALTWEMTPYHPHARLRGVGVDCAMLPAEVYEEVGLIPRLDPEYTSQWMMHRDEELFLQWITPHADEIERESVQMGDLGVWRFGRTYSHAVIIGEPPEGIHSIIRGGGVVRCNIDRDTELSSRPARFFSVRGLA